MENNYSVHSTIWHQKFELGDHPISNGVKSFDLVDEGYFFMHWKNEDIKIRNFKYHCKTSPARVIPNQFFFLWTVTHTLTQKKLISIFMNISAK